MERLLPRFPRIRRLISILCAPSWALRAWLDHRLKLDTYELVGDEFGPGRGRRPGALVRVREINAWQIHAEMGFDIVAIELENGRSVLWLDKYGDLIAILRQVASDRERPWRFA